jgi:glyoxylase-like metal-dependent hydrolase (beta-lactamase superfamily II)
MHWEGFKVMLQRTSATDAETGDVRALRACIGFVNAPSRAAGTWLPRWVRRIIACGCAGTISMALASAAAPVPQLVAPGVYLLMGHDQATATSDAGRAANIAFVVGPRGVVVVDTGISFLQGEEIIHAVASVTRRPIRLAVMTHPSQEVVFGAAAFQARGIPVLMHRTSAALMAARCETCLRRLTDTLGAAAMRGTRVVSPDQVVDGSQWIDPIGRPLLLIAPSHGSAPGALAVLDPTTRTLIAGSLASIDSVPDMRDADGKSWRGALAMLEATRCVHLVPAYGKAGSCAQIAGLDGYFAALDRRVRELLDSGIGLAELPARCELPEFAGWNRYGELHVQNANHVYLRMERASFEN